MPLSHRFVKMHISTLFLLSVCILASLLGSSLAQRNSSIVYNRHNDSYQQNELQRDEITQFFETKNVIKTMYKLLFGTESQSMATSRQVLNMFVKILELLKSSFGQRARSSGPTGLRGSIDNAAQAGLSMLQGFVKSAFSRDSNCVHRHICEGTRNAARESREFGGLIAQVGGIAASQLLEKRWTDKKEVHFGTLYEAVRAGQRGDDCRAHYRHCGE